MAGEKQALNSEVNEVGNSNEDPDSTGQHLGEFDLEQFFKNNYKLFAILSVFGAISVYLPEIGNIETNLFLRAGFVSTLFLILLVVFTINRRFFSQVGRTIGLIKSFLHPSSDTYEMIFFFIPFNALAVSLVAISGSYTATLAFLFQFIGASLGVVITFHLVKTIDRRTNNDETGSGDESQNLIGHTIAFFVMGFILLAIGGRGMEVVKSNSSPKQNILFEFTPNLGISAVLDSLFFGIGFAGLIYWFLALVAALYGIKKLVNKVHKIAYSKIIPRIPNRN